jgi:hypothetical protein
MMGVGTVEIPRPVKPLTLEQYRQAMARKINRMVERAGPQAAARLLAETVERVDGLQMARRLDQVGELMAEESETLQERAGLFNQIWPIKPMSIRPDQKGIDPQEEMTLAEFLGQVYHGLT